MRKPILAGRHAKPLPFSTTRMNCTMSSRSSKPLALGVLPRGVLVALPSLCWLVRCGDCFCRARRGSRYGRDGGRCRGRAGRGTRHLPDDLVEAPAPEGIEDLLGHGGGWIWRCISRTKARGAVENDLGPASRARCEFPQRSRLTTAGRTRSPNFN